jgi:hypothetical protein
MTEVILKVPDDIKNIIDEIDEPIYLEAIKSVAQHRLHAKEGALKEIVAQAAKLEAKYSKKFEAFSASVPDSIEGHDDWIEWTFLHAQIQKLQSSVEKFKLLIGK